MYLKNLTHHRLIQAMKGQGFWDKTTNNLKQEVLDSFNMEEMETEMEELQLHSWREGITAPPGSPEEQSHPFINDPVLTLDVIPAQAKPQNIYHQLMLAQCHLSSCQNSFNQALAQLKAARKRVGEVKQKIRNIIKQECQESLREVKQKSSRNWRADYRPPRTNKRTPKRLQRAHTHGFKSTRDGAPKGNLRGETPLDSQRKPAGKETWVTTQEASAVTTKSEIRGEAPEKERERTPKARPLGRAGGQGGRGDQEENKGEKESYRAPKGGNKE